MSNLKDIQLTESQKRVLDSLKTFLDSNQRIFLLKGYAGTGKTTLMRFLIEHLKKAKRPYKLLAPTGRAAKILANYTNSHADTIHRMIYYYKSFNRTVEDDKELFNPHSKNPNQLYLVFEPQRIDPNALAKTVYIIDESSMISDLEEKNVIQAKFGSGRLLHELLLYDERQDSKFIFIGDPCQLPPIKGDISPAMEKSYIQAVFKYSVQESFLTQIMRQKDDNTITHAAASIRKLWEDAPLTEEVYGNFKVWGFLPIKKYKDINCMPNIPSMENEYFNDIKKYGYNHSVFICRSNRDCNLISMSIRKRLGFHGVLSKGDLLMVVQNQQTSGLMNGDMVEVMDILEQNIYTPSNKYHTPIKFMRVKVKELFTGREVTTLLIEETITSYNNNLDSTKQTSLFLDFIIRMKDKGITEKKKPSEFNDALRKDPYLNALRCSYGYAVTCHKAQGGEWNNVYIHVGPRNITINPTKAIYQWIYTAITRAKEKVFLVDDFYIK